ncbi:MAG: hypothetical protein ACI8RP_000679 [Urechidicola sp.]|jgi:hypothetical protein
MYTITFSDNFIVYASIALIVAIICFKVFWSILKIVLPFRFGALPYSPYSAPLQGNRSNEKKKGGFPLLSILLVFIVFFTLMGISNTSETPIEKTDSENKYNGKSVNQDDYRLPKKINVSPSKSKRIRINQSPKIENLFLLQIKCSNNHDYATSSQVKYQDIFTNQKVIIGIKNREEYGFKILVSFPNQGSLNRFKGKQIRTKKISKKSWQVYANDFDNFMK